MIRNDLQSRTIDAMRLTLIFCVVLVHAYTATRADIDTGLYPVYRFVSFLFSLNIAQIAIPGFFFISGFLYFRTHRTYRQRIRHSIRTLGGPYLFWNGLILGLYWVIECIPHFQGLFSGDNLPIHQYSFMDFIRAFWDCGHPDNGNGTPILHQFWYIRNLLILGLLSPLIRRYVEWTGLAGLGALIAWWVFAPGQAMLAKSFAFFAFGAWFSIRNREFLEPFRRHMGALGVIFVTFAALVMIFWEHPWSVWLNRFNDLIGIMFFSALTGCILARRKQTRSLAYLQGLTFFIYATHDPLIIVVKRVLLRAMPMTDLALTANYFISTFAVIGICTGAYFLINRLCPPLMSLMVGARSPKKTHVR